MNRENLKNIVYSIFSDTLMIFLAILIIPVVIIIQFFELTPTQELIVWCADWIIYIAFFLEFILKIYVADNRIKHIKTNKLDSIISIIVIFSPLLEMVSVYFEAAPALRTLRITRIMRFSKLTRLAAVSGKARTTWRKVNLKSYAMVCIIIALSFVGSFFKPTFQYSSNDVVWFSVFIQVIGVVYAIISGFIIVNVWNEYNALDGAARKEAISLRNVYLLTLQLNNKKFTEILKKNILNYTKSVVDAYWKEKEKIEGTREKFIQVFKSLDDFNSKKAKDLIILDNIDEELRNASTHRADVLSLISAKTPNILWILLIVLSFLLVFSFYIASFENQLLATVTITIVSIAVAIVYDMDYPFKAGFWVISPEVYFELEDFLNK